MKDLSVSQCYLICTLNKNGKLPALDTEIQVCLLAGGLIDLMFTKSVVLNENKKLCIIDELDAKVDYLNSLYIFIKESKPMKVDKLASEYNFSFSDKRLKLLIYDIGISLSNLGYVSAENGGLFGNTSCFIPNPKIVDNVIQNIRAELLEDGSLSEEIIALVSLMDQSNQIKRYFSKHEKYQLKARLKEIKDTDANKLVKEMMVYIETMVAIIATTSFCP